jgi:hypothetical protein
MNLMKLFLCNYFFMLSNCEIVIKFLWGEFGELKVCLFWKVYFKIWMFVWIWREYGIESELCFWREFGVFKVCCLFYYLKVFLKKG